jgi:F0F1-type ATP synthase assembly protein I
MTPQVTKNMGESLRAAGALSTVGLSFVLALGMGFWLGTVLDRWLGTKPLFTIACFFLGLAAGILNVYRIVSQAYPTTSSTGPAGPVRSTGPTESSPTESGPTESSPTGPGPARSTSPDLTERDLYDDSGR